MCKFITFLFDLIPIPRFRSYLIKTHLAKCSFCQKELVPDSVLEEKFKIPIWIQSEQSLWPQISDKIFTCEDLPHEHRPRALPFSVPRWQWALVVLALVVLVGINLLIERDIGRRSIQGEISVSSTTPRIIITRAEIKGKKAKPFIYQTKERFFIWFEEPEGD